MENPYAPPESEVGNEAVKVKLFAKKLLRVNRFVFLILLLFGAILATNIPDFWGTKAIGWMLSASVAVFFIGVVLSFIEGFKGLE